jgi:hypothetical protein
MEWRGEINENKKGWPELGQDKVSGDGKGLLTKMC